MNITIVGAGKLGERLAKYLTAENHDITIVDIDDEKVSRVVENFDVQGVCGGATICDTLSEAGIESCDLIITTTPSDENNILCCLIAKKMGAKSTIARVRNPEYYSQIEFMREELGLTITINPELSAAKEICSIIQFPSAVNVESFSRGRIDIASVKVTADSPICNKKISDLSYKYKNKLLICAVTRGDDVTIPKGEFVIEAGDTLHITASHKDLYKAFKEITNKKASVIKDVMLIGGSRLSVYVANMLEQVGKNVVIIEGNKEACDKLFELCPKASIIHGDYTDYNLLNQEGIDKMDAVVTLTDSDETNLLVSKYSESCGVKKNITKITNPNMPKLVKSVGVDSYVDVSQVTCDSITQYVRAKKSVSSSYMKTLYKLVDDQIEAIEFATSADTKFLGKPISSLKIKKNVLIAAIYKNNKTVFPSGNDVIELGDSVIVVSKEHKIYSLNDILA